MGYATVAELGLFLQEELSVDQEPAAQMLLDLAAEAIRADLGQRIDHVADEAITLEASHTSLLLLPELPVTDVADVTIDGDVLAASDYEWNRDGRLIRAAGTWTLPVTVTYTHGYEPSDLPGVLKIVSLQAAARAWTNPTGTAREQLGSYGVSYAQQGFNRGAVITLTEEEQRLLDPLRP